MEKKNERNDMVKAGTDKKFIDFIESFRVRWSYANSILYGMCRERPRHDLKDVAASKLFLISRGFFNADGKEEDMPEDEGYYYDVIAPRLQDSASYLDSLIRLLNEDCRTVLESRVHILEAQKYLMDIFADIKTFDNRQLAARYLHFHCPKMVYIYSSKADGNVSGIVTLEDKPEIPKKSDVTYLEFFDKMLELQKYLYSETGIYRSPLELDRFLTAGHPFF